MIVLAVNTLQKNGECTVYHVIFSPNMAISNRIVNVEETFKTTNKNFSF